MLMPLAGAQAPEASKPGQLPVEPEVALAGIAIASEALEGIRSPIAHIHVDAPAVRTQLGALRLAEGVVRAVFDRCGTDDTERTAAGVDELMGLCASAGRKIAQAIDTDRAEAGWVLGPATNFAVSVLADHWRDHGAEGLSERVEALCLFVRSPQFYGFARQMADAPATYVESLESESEAEIRLRMSIAQGSLQLMRELEVFAYLNPPERLLECLTEEVVARAEEHSREQLACKDVTPELAVTWRQSTLLRISRLAADAYRRHARKDFEAMTTANAAGEKRSLASLVLPWRQDGFARRHAKQIVDEAVRVFALVDDYACAALELEQRERPVALVAKG